jgi:hypothetical protein
MQPGLINMEYLYTDVPEDQPLRQYSRALAEERRDEREPQAWGFRITSGISRLVRSWYPA